ncbi:MAG: hypothetical protein R2783_05920 [Gelidibacter sp.]
MLEIVIVFLIGKYFYKLAEEFDQSKWLYAVIGVLTYFAGAFIAGVILFFVDLQFDMGVNWENTLLLTLLVLPFAVATCYLLHYLLKRSWSKSTVVTKDEIQDIGKPIE